MKKPIEPKQEDCCNSGCNPCIFDVYHQQLKLYETSQVNCENIYPVKNAISQLEYTKFYVVSNIDLMNEHKIILFREAKTTSDERQLIWTPGDHFLFKYVSKEINCTRAYTPVTIKKDEEKHDFAILVKRYVNGLVSNHLCNLNKGDITLWRGPYGHYKYILNKFSRIIMICQGTGIAPLYSIINQILGNEEDMTKIFLFYCCKNLNSILLRNELYSCRSYWNFKYEVFLSEGLKEAIKYREPIVPHRFDVKFFYQHDIISKNNHCDQFLICGSKEFIEHYKHFLIENGINKDLIVTF